MTIEVLFTILAAIGLLLVGAVTRDHFALRATLRRLREDTATMSTLEVSYETDLKDKVAIPAQMLESLLKMVYMSQPIKENLPALAGIAEEVAGLVDELTDGVPIRDKDIPNGS